MAGAFFTIPQVISFDFGTDLNQTIEMSFDGFDSSLGTLTSVHLDYTLDETLNNTAANVGSDIFNPGLAVVESVGDPAPLSADSTVEFSVVGQSGLLSLFETNNLVTPGFTGDVNPGITTVGTITENVVGEISICTDSSCLADNGSDVGDLSSFSANLS